MLPGELLGDGMNKKYLRWCCGAACALLLCWGAQVWADDVVSETGEPTVDVAPAYQNAAQAAHDANLAEAAYEKIDAEMAALEGRLAVEEAKALEEQDPALIDQLNAELDDLAVQRTGIEQGAIAQMRDDGMGWGEIAHALGVHPGVLGLGHTKKGMVAGDEVAMATAMDMKTGNGLGHTKGQGNSAGNGQGNNGNNGHSGDKGKNDKGNNGNGNSNGNNNGKKP